MARARVLYDAGSFGVGELLLEEDVLLWQRAPRPGLQPFRQPPARHASCRSTSPVNPDDFADVELDLLVVHAVSGRGRDLFARRWTWRDGHLRRVGRAVRPSRRGARGGLVLRRRTASGSSFPATESLARVARRLRLARGRLQAPSACARGGAHDARRGRSERARGNRARSALRRAGRDLGTVPYGRQPALAGHGELAFHVDVSASSVARRAFSLLRDLGVESEIRTYRQRAFDRSTRYQLHVLGGPGTVDVLREAGIVGRGGRPLTRPPARVVGRPCCRAAYARGALLGAGSVSGPRAASSKCASPETEGARVPRSHRGAGGRRPPRERAARARGGVHAGTRRRSPTCSPWRERATPPSPSTSTRCRAAARAAANRLANADHANLVRTSRAAQDSCGRSRELEERGALATLPDELQEIAALRVKHPALSFRELAAKCEPRVTKAAVQRRLARLVQLAEG